MEYIVVWSGLGLLGTAVMLSKSATKGRTIAVALLSLPHAIIVGPIFLLGNLVSRPQQLYPHCKSSIPRDATVCPECTRDVSTSH